MSREETLTVSSDKLTNTFQQCFMNKTVFELLKLPDLLPCKSPSRITLVE